MAHAACLVCLISTVNGHNIKTLGLSGACSGNITNLKQSIFSFGTYGQCSVHRHLSIIDCLSFVMCLLLAPLVIGFFFAVTFYSTNEANKAGSMRC
jgi:hypothetical protein